MPRKGSDGNRYLDRESGSDDKSEGRDDGDFRWQNELAKQAKGLLKSFSSRIDGYSTRLTYLLLGGLIFLVASGLNSPVIARGGITASVVYVFHETLHLRVHELTRIIRDRLGEGWTLAHAFSPTIGIVAIDLFISVPMFSSGEYVWPYTVALVAHFAVVLLIYLCIKSANKELSGILQPCLRKPYSSILAGSTIAILDLYFAVRVFTTPELKAIQVLSSTSEAITHTDGSLLFMFACIGVLFTVLVLLLLILYGMLYLALAVLLGSIPILIYFRPDLVVEGLETAPQSVRIWAAVSGIIFAIISVTPSVLKGRPFLKTFR
ncbi:hypothetical protein [Halobacterium salinarum]|uniref:Uncharacterized protein n=1 Tax=Halobacterium salinarum (strain ATCC 33171 / DSM 3754 / JCM 8978 / NBRC 102687 / NCIMB 764 / 91-R6) TaxID=2597657 RepID=A0A4D6GX95_HALS9|nr:hypothetical protein [Halobacterium salinarum]QCC44847.1 uncharacterized protein HBSAL_05910 [Halobacterium salinarum]TYO75572.1 hypothetical protein APQ99_01895 [Halobacterium salinarum DSM 3754]